ncbi:MAG: cyclic lactone autoinducer peptide [Lachnospiraceae bacterium]|nr:cyclic lactone autoinducer peptide [Lachnospiraceae bacterium]
MTKEKLLKSLITKVADKSANFVCGFILYQDKLPKEVMRFKKKSIDTNIK